MAFLDPVLNPLVLPLLAKSPFITILVLAFVISSLITLVYKFFTNQGEMKELKTKQKEYQKKMKGLRSNPEEAMKVQKEAMKLNMSYMKHSFKPTLITMLPILLIFGWMTAHLSFIPLSPDQPYSITATFSEEVNGDAELVIDSRSELISGSIQKINGAATWNLKSSEGSHFLKVKIGSDEQQKKVTVGDYTFEKSVSSYEHSDIESITINYDKLKPLHPYSLFGWEPGWLGVYILLSIIFSIGLRKLLKIH